jgi:hypothetical protein
LSITANASITGGTITLGNDAGNNTNFGSVTFNSAGAVVIAEKLNPEYQERIRAHRLLNASAFTDGVELQSVSRRRVVQCERAARGRRAYDATDVALGSTLFEERLNRGVQVRICLIVTVVVFKVFDTCKQGGRSTWSALGKPTEEGL